MKTIDFNRNWKLINLDTNKDKGYFDLDCGKFGVMFFEFDIDFNVDSGFEFESVDVKLSSYDWDCDGLKSGMLNNRNTKLICEKLEERISSNPESWGFDSEQLRYEAQLDFETEREIAYFNERC